MTLSPKIFIPIVLLVIVGVIYYAENKSKKAPSEVNPRATRSREPKLTQKVSDPAVESPSEVSEIDTSAVPTETQTSPQENSSPSEEIPVPDSERQAYEQIVKEAIQNSQPTKAFEAPTEKGQIWGNPYDDKLPAN